MASLSKLKKEDLNRVLKKLEEGGVTHEMWLAMAKAHPFELRLCVEKWPTFVPTDLYSAEEVCEALGFALPDTQTIPPAREWEMRCWYGGWTIGDLAAKGLLQSHLFAEDPSVLSWKAPAGYYRVVLPMATQVPFDRVGEYNACLKQELQPLATAVAATLLIVHRAKHPQRPLGTEMMYCKEQRHGFSAALYSMHDVLSLTKMCFPTSALRNLILGMKA